MTTVVSVRNEVRRRPEIRMGGKREEGYGVRIGEDTTTREREEGAGLP
jgi:hypothetical protein